MPSLLPGGSGKERIQGKERSHYKKGKIWDKVPKGGGGLTQTQIFFLSQFTFLETTNLASPYFNKIWLNLMHTNLISRVIHATVPVPGGGGRRLMGGRKKNTKNVHKVGVVSQDWDTIPNVSVIFFTPPLRCTSLHRLKEVLVSKTGWNLVKCLVNSFIKLCDTSQSVQQFDC